MKFNPITQQLFINNGILIKELYCPLSKDWETLAPTTFFKGKMCDHCQMTVIDTALMTESELHGVMNENPHTCLKVDLNQDNLTITYD